ncbi:MAG TPA: cupredoxin family copper-binding protein [Acetobacteraceae bacterium]
MTHIQRRVAAVLGASMLFGVGISYNHRAASASTDAAISIDNFTFKPASITVPPGTRVVWTNHDDIPHQVVGASDPRTLKSPPLDTNDSFAFTFAKAGTYKYFCGMHPMMQGTIVVQ